MKTEYFLLVHHTISILAKLSTRCFDHSSDISCSLLVNPSHTDESWEGRNTCMWIYIYIYIYVIQGKNNQAINILIKKFQLLPLSIHVNILNYK